MNAATLSVETVPGRDGTWLCAIDKDGRVEPLARFEGAASVQRFHALFTLARAVSHAQGQMGI